MINFNAPKNIQPWPGGSHASVVIQLLAQPCTSISNLALK